MNMKAITMAFKEVLLDEEGNPVKDNEGKTVYVRVFRKVRHNAAYFPRTYHRQAENPTCFTKGVVPVIEHYSFLYRAYGKTICKRRNPY